jgi:hypothetical protein
MGSSTSHTSPVPMSVPLERLENRVAGCRERSARDLRSARDAITEAASKARDYALELHKAIQLTSVRDEILVGQGSRDMSEVMGDYLHRVDRATAAQERAARRATDGSSGILDLLKQLQSVARSSKLVTLNAAAWAERFEANGPLALLVAQMDKLNRDINREATTIAKAATELLALLPPLVESISHLRSVSLKFITDSTSQGGEVVRAVTQLRERADGVAHNGDQRAVEVTRAAEEASRKLDCFATFDRCFQQLNHVLGRLAEQEGRTPTDDENKD